MNARGDAVDRQPCCGESPLHARAGIDEEHPLPTTTAVAGPQMSGVGRGVPVPSITTTVLSGGEGGAP